jgi:hypothetical protein
MGDSSKTKNNSRSSSRGSNINASALGNRNLSPRNDLDAQISAATGPVKSAKDACAWLEKKGWLLSSESYSKNKLAEILFSVALSFKLPSEADAAIRSAAYIIRDRAEDELADVLSEKLIDKFTDKINQPIDKLLDSVTAAKSFLDATSQQQASELISLQESAKQHNDIVKALAETTDKLNQPSASRSLNESTWPLLFAANPTPTQAVHPASLLRSHNPASANPQIIQRVSLASKQLLIEYGPLEENVERRNKSIEEQRELRKTFNDWIDKDTTAPEGEIPPPPSRAICSVSIFDRPALLLEFESTASKDSFVKLCDKNPLLLQEIGPKARIRPRTFPIIFRFVPCSGLFDPNNDSHLRNIERENDLVDGSIVSATWCKRPEKRSHNQTTATLKVACLNPETANKLLTGRIRVDDHLVNVRKDLRIPIRCVKCQEYGHTQDACIGVEKCANCTSESHGSHNCNKAPKCVSCGEESSHPSSSPSCPTFIHKSETLDERFPENTMPYFPTSESWTWASSPSNPPASASPLPPPQPSNPRQPNSLRPVRQAAHRYGRGHSHPHSQPRSQPRQTDNGWPNERRQTTLTGAWGSQPTAAPSTSVNSRPDLPPPAPTQ